jgi:hypothetical protein
MKIKTKVRAGRSTCSGPSPVPVPRPTPGTQIP